MRSLQNGFARWRPSKILKNNSLLVGKSTSICRPSTPGRRSSCTDSAGFTDWYMMTDTAVAGGRAIRGPFGVVDLSLLPTSRQARRLLADTRDHQLPGRPQQKYARAPGRRSDPRLTRPGSRHGHRGDGTAEATLNQLAAPGRAAGGSAATTSGLSGQFPQDRSGRQCGPASGTATGQAR